jgi:hypothetical protein
MQLSRRVAGHNHSQSHHNLQEALQISDLIAPTKANKQAVKKRFITPLNMSRNSFDK